MTALEHSLWIAVRAGTPILLATLGEVYAERSGVLNLGVEGMMIMGAVAGFVTAYLTGNVLLGFLAAVLAGVSIAFIHAFVSVTLRGNQVISGLALTMLGLGLSALIGRSYVGAKLPFSILTVKIPVLSKIPVIGPSLFNQDLVVYFSYILVAILWWLLYHTKLGISIRAVGEDPSAADSAGVNVYAIRYACTLLGGALAGLGGAYLSLVYTPSWIENMTAGKGWIAIALVIFAMWDPIRAMVGSYLFGGLEALQYYLQLTYGWDPCLLGTIPYVATIIALLFGVSETLRKRVGAPSALGKPYFREEKTL